MLRRRLLPLTVVVCVALTACQDDSDPAASSSPTSGPTSTSPSLTPGGESPAAAPSLDATSREFLRRLERGTGTRGTAHLEMQVRGDAPSTSSGDMAYDARGTQLRIATRAPKLGSGAVQVVVQRAAAFISIPGFTRPGTFFRVKQGDAAWDRLVGSSVQLSPEKSVEAFKAGLVRARELGHARVDGTPTTRYAVTVDATRSLQAQGSQPVPGMPGQLTYRIWLDGQDRIRRMGLTVGGSDLTVELSRWGQPVSIEAPPRSALVDPPPGF